MIEWRVCLSRATRLFIYRSCFSAGPIPGIAPRLPEAATLW